jgi:hypothetical protein
MRLKARPSFLSSSPFRDVAYFNLRPKIVPCHWALSIPLLASCPIFRLPDQLAFAHTWRLAVTSSNDRIAETLFLTCFPCHTTFRPLPISTVCPYPLPLYRLRHTINDGLPIACFYIQPCCHGIWCMSADLWPRKCAFTLHCLT